MIPHDRTLEDRVTLVNEYLTDSALDLVAAVRFGSATEVRDVLARVKDGRTDALCVVLAAMVDPEQTPVGLLGWVDGVESEPRTGRPPKAREHGSERGYNQHTYRGEDACLLCRVAHNAHNQARAPRSSRKAA